MKKIIYIFLIVILGSCAKENTTDTDLLKDEIRKTDISMSELALKEGFNNALIKNADENFVKLSEGMHPIVGKKSFEELVNGKPGPKTLSWEPKFVDVASSGDLGYSWGNWIFNTPDTILYGNYITVWKKQSDGSWKMTFDSGSNTPAPENNQE